MFITINTYIKNKTKTPERFQISNLTTHTKDIEKQVQTKSKINRRKEITKIRAEIRKMESK
jgi:hypothetical protein